MPSKKQQALKQQRANAALQSFARYSGAACLAASPWEFVDDCNLRCQAISGGTHGEFSVRLNSNRGWSVELQRFRHA